MQAPNPGTPATAPDLPAPSTHPDAPPRRHLALVSLLVRDYDEAIAWYTRVLRLHLVEDTRLSDSKRWVVLGFDRSPAEASRAGQPPATATGLLLAQASNPVQRAQVGQQGAGRVWLFLHTDNLADDHRHMTAQGARFIESPRHEAYGTVVVFEDLYGNRWDLIQPLAPQHPGGR